MTGYRYGEPGVTYGQAGGTYGAWNVAAQESSGGGSFAPVRRRRHHRPRRRPNLEPKVYELAVTFPFDVGIAVAVDMPPVRSDVALTITTRIDDPRDEADVEALLLLL